MGKIKYHVAILLGTHTIPCKGGPTSSLEVPLRLPSTLLLGVTVKTLTGLDHW